MTSRTERKKFVSECTLPFSLLSVRKAPVDRSEGRLRPWLDSNLRDMPSLTFMGVATVVTVSSRHACVQGQRGQSYWRLQNFTILYGEWDGDVLATQVAAAGAGP